MGLPLFPVGSPSILEEIRITLAETPHPRSVGSLENGHRVCLRLPKMTVSPGHPLSVFLVPHLLRVYPLLRAGTTGVDVRYSGDYLTSLELRAGPVRVCSLDQGSEGLALLGHRGILQPSLLMGEAMPRLKLAGPTKSTKTAVQSVVPPREKCRISQLH